jgi:nucleoside-diphosphate-sugar epimerase
VRIVVTGAAGYLGRFLCRRLLTERDVDEVTALDIQPGEHLPDDPRLRFFRRDIARDDLRDLLHGTTAVCHLAFVLGSAASDSVAQTVNLEGTRRVLEEARSNGVRNVIVASSVSAYGALADNPHRLTEEAPLRADARYRYAWHKRRVEEWLDDFEQQHPAPAVARLRISVVLGPPPRPGSATRVLTIPVLPLPGSFQVQFVHVEDVAEAFILALRHRARGAFNVSADPPLTATDITRVTGQWRLPLPPQLFGLAATLLRRIGVSDVGRLDFLRHPLLVDCAKIRRELGWAPRFSGPGALRELIPTK